MALHRDIATHHAHEAVRNGQAETTAGESATVLVLELVKFLEQLVVSRLGDTLTTVIDADSEKTWLIVQLCTYDDSPGVGEFQGIADEIGDDLAKTQFVTQYLPIERRWNHGLQADATAKGDAGMQFHHRLYDLLDRHRVVGKDELAGLDAAEVEDIVDQRHQGQATLVGDAGQLPLFVVERRFQQELVHVDHGVQRRADLVAHGCQETGLGPVGLVGCQPGLFDGLCCLFLLADIADKGREQWFVLRCHRCNRDLDRDLPAIAMQGGQLQALVQRRAFAGLQVTRHTKRVLMAHRWWDEPVRHVAAEHLAACPAEDALGMTVVLDDVALGVDGNDAVEAGIQRGLGDGLVARREEGELAIGLLGLFALARRHRQAGRHVVERAHGARDLVVAVDRNLVAGAVLDDRGTCKFEITQLARQVGAERQREQCYQQYLAQRDARHVAPRFADQLVDDAGREPERHRAVAMAGLFDADLDVEHGVLDLVQVLVQRPLLVEQVRIATHCQDLVVVGDADVDDLRIGQQVLDQAVERGQVVGQHRVLDRFGEQLGDAVGPVAQLLLVGVGQVAETHRHEDDQQDDLDQRDAENRLQAKGHRCAVALFTDRSAV